MAGPTLRPTASPLGAALALLDEAFHRLRGRPGLVLLHALGSMPFGLGLLYFWSEMSRSAFAAERCAAEALGLAGLYVWMKTCHARFMTALYAQVAGQPDPAWSPGRMLRAAATQAAVHATACPVLLVASIVLLPSAWCVTFYQNAVLYGNGERRTLRAVVRLSWTQACALPFENHAFLTLLALFSLFVFAELLVGLLFLPELLRLFTGIETVFSLSGFHLLNSTLLAATAVLSYMVVDPLLKAACVLRCFQAQSQHTGEDLLLALRDARDRRRAAGRAALCGLLLLTLTAASAPTAAAAAADAPPGPGRGTPMPSSSPGHPLSRAGRVGPNSDWDSFAFLSQWIWDLRQSRRNLAALRGTSALPEAPATANAAAAAAPVPPAPPALIEAPVLEAAIVHTLQQPRYSWRLPRERVRPPPDAEVGAIRRLFRQFNTWIRTAFTAGRDLLRHLSRGVRRWLGAREHGLDPGEPAASNWPAAVPYAVVALTAVICAGVALFAWRARARRRAATTVAMPTAAVALPDLADEAVSADQRPPEDWLHAARDLVDRGDLRLGLRAAYLASLAFLAERRLLTIARHKSNVDYRRELARRAAQLPTVVACFESNVHWFDRVWYGAHVPTASLVEGFLADVERMRAELEP